MKRILAGLTAALLMLAGMTTAAEDYRIAEDNTDGFAALLIDLVDAYEAPSAEDAARLEGDLSAIRAVSEADYEIASAIAADWNTVYLEGDYTLFLYSGGERAVELEQAGLTDGSVEAIVVLGFELKDGEMTDELKGRCEAAAAVARSFPGAILICSGGATGQNNPDNHTEAGLMKDYFVNQCGIDDTRIFIDENAMTTVDNAVNTFRILQEQGIRTMTIVTSAYHQQRGQVIYRAVGAIYRHEFGYRAESVGNYCYDIEPANDAYKRDYRIAARQLAQVLNLPKEAMDGLKR